MIQHEKKRGERKLSTFILIHSPVQPDWPDAPCAYLQFSPFYDRPATQARAALSG